MKKLDVDKTLHVLGSVGVIAGILLLAYELNQNRQMMEAQTRHELSMGIVDIQLTTASSPALLEGYSKADGASESMELWEIANQLRYNALFRYWENVHYQYRNGLYDEVEFAKQRTAFGGWVSNSPTMTAYWCLRGSAYSPEFAREMDDIVGADRC